MGSEHWKAKDQAARELARRMRDLEEENVILKSDAPRYPRSKVIVTQGPDTVSAMADQLYEPCSRYSVYLITTHAPLKNNLHSLKAGA